MKFSIYEHKDLLDDGVTVRFFFFVLMECGVIVCWTDFHKFLVSGRAKVITNADRKKCTYVNLFLNYVFFEKYNVKRLADVENEHVRRFLMDYGLCKLPSDNQSTHRNKTTVNNCINTVIDFMTNFSIGCSQSKFIPDQMYRVVETFDRKRKKHIKTKKLTFEVYCKESSKKEIFRDIPEKAFEMLLHEVSVNYKDILMLFALQAFAGLRPSEACNVRRADSKLGCGVFIYSSTDGINDIKIDLTKELELRSDHVTVGGIKREREQSVYPKFINIFIQCYREYLNYINGREYEQEYGPLTINQRGKAMTYSDYKNQFKKMADECAKKMIMCDDTELVNYGFLVLENGISPHILRHWFTVQLVLSGEDVAGIQYWRGDNSPESALEYLQNKSDIERKFREVNNKIFDFGLWKAGKEHDKFK